MERWIEWRTKAASWRGLVIWLGLLFAYSYWAFFTTSPFMIAAAASPALPEMSPGFPPGQPAAALADLGDARNAYLVFQLADLAYTALNALVYATVFALVLRRFGWTQSPARYSLLLPLVYAVVEIGENGLLALMASGILPATGAAGLSQQLLTNVKLASGAMSGFLMLAGLLTLVIAAVIRLIRGNPASPGNESSG